jgi:hypothetical protein
VTTRKIDALVASETSPFDYGNTFEEETVGGKTRLRIGLDESHEACLCELTSELSGPFQLLYVLHTTRTGADLGRYESHVLTAPQVGEFLRRFGRFLSHDARHDFWIRSHGDDATIVFDRHNLIYAYGPLQQFEAVLLRIGACRAGLPRVPDPHAHHYHPEWDSSELAVLAALQWTRKPLREDDLQFKTP